MSKFLMSLIVGAALCLSLSVSAQAVPLLNDTSFALDQSPKTHPEFDFVTFTYIDVPDVNADGTFVDPTFTRQAGSHPDFSFYLKTKSKPDGSPAEALRNVEVDLPPGVVGDPTAFPTCSTELLTSPGNGGAKCPVSSQLGVAEITAWGSGGPVDFVVGIFNISHGDDVPALFGFNYGGVVGLINARVRPGDYGISSGSFSIPQGEAVSSVRVKLWGVPSDISHDSLRQGPFGGIAVSNFNTPSLNRFSANWPPTAFLTAPTNCSGNPLTFTVRANSWENPGQYETRTATADEDGTPFTIEDCDRVPFAPSAAAKSLSRSAEAPTGLAVDIAIPQPDDAYAIASAHVRSVKMKFPEGISVNPSSAAGLEACSPAQISLGDNNAPTCPAGATIGRVTIDTPLLDTPITGDMILATQNDNPYHTLIGLYIAAKGPGFYLKLPGKIDLDQTTGQMTATFENTPQLPFSNMQVSFNGGSLASLATAQKCGTYNTRIELTSWASDDPVVINSPMTFNQNCEAKAFAPSLSAGLKNPAAGKASAFTMQLTRQDGSPYLQNLSMVLPKGLLADLASVPQCDPAPASGGYCPAAAKVGTVGVLSGPGAQPLPLTGNVYFTGPYKDAPFGLSIQVPTAGQAGPFDLGVVTVRAAIYVDRATAQATVKSDPFPTIIQGIPLRMRQVTVDIDRPNFILNPTNCAKQSILADLGALGGATNQQAVPFQVIGCGDLDLKPKLTMELTGSKSTKDGTSPGVNATLTDPGGGSNYSKVEAKLPLALVLEPKNAQSLCKPEQAAAYNCPKTSIVGSATARSVLPHELSGPVYFVEGRRKTASGRTVSSLPDLWIPLSGDGVTIDIRASSQVDANDRLVTTFHDLPDAPIKKFNLKINGGKHGILVVVGQSTCKRDMTFDTRYTGQNGEVKIGTSKPKVAGCGPAVKSTKTTKKSVTVKVGNLGAGKLTVTGGGLLAQASKTLKAGPEATVTAKLTRKAQASLRRDGKVSVKVSVAYKPKVGKTVKLTQAVTITS